MKTFKRIYYPLIIALTVIMLILSIVDSNAGTAKKQFDSEFYTNSQKHVEKLSADYRNEFSEDNDKEEIISYFETTLNGFDNVRKATAAFNDADKTSTAALIKNSDGVPLVTYTVQKTILTAATVRQTKSFEDKVVYAGKEITNLIAVVPGSVTKNAFSQMKDGKSESEVAFGDAVIITGNYDSLYYGASKAVTTANMLESIRYFSKSESLKNDLVFVFSDSGIEGNLGIYAFLNQFKGFNNIVSRAKLGASFDSLGNKGTLSLVGASENYPALTSSYAKINKGVLASSAVTTAINVRTDFDAFTNIPALSFANIGGVVNYNSKDDTAKNLGSNQIKQNSDMMYKIAAHYGDYDLNKITSGSKGASYFSYLDLGMVKLSSAASYVLGGLIIALLAAIIVFNIKKKSFNFVGMLIGALTQILALAAAAASLYIAYFVLTLMLTGFGAIPFRSIASLQYTNPAIFIFGIILAGALTVIFYILFRKAFGVRANDIIRGNVLLTAITAAVLSFAVTKIAYAFSILAILWLVVMLVTVLLNDAFKKKTGGMPMGELFLYVIPVALTMPITIPILYTLSAFLPAILMPLFLTASVVLLASALPYAEMLKKPLSAFMQRYEKTVKIERVVTEQIEDRAKKGKFTEVTHKKTTREKVKLTYLNRAGIAITCCVCMVALIFSTCFGVTYNKNISGSKSYSNIAYDGALVYVKEQLDDGAATANLEISDFAAFKYISRYMRGFKWDGEKSVYSMPYAGVVTSLFPEITKTDLNNSDLDYPEADAEYTITAAESYQTKITLTISGLSKVSKLIFETESDFQFTEIDNPSLTDEMTFVMPEGLSTFKIKVVATDNASPTLTICCEELHIGGAKGHIETYEQMTAKYESKDAVAPYLLANTLLRLTKTL